LAELRLSATAGNFELFPYHPRAFLFDFCHDFGRTFAYTKQEAAFAAGIT
jgi:hypothetical protein